jgi:hypothetical protein
MSAVGEDSFTPHDLESATAQRRKLRLQAQNYVPKPTLTSVKVRRISHIGNFL